MYVMLRRRVGGFAALGAALALAVFPSFVAVSRDNGVDPLLLALLVLACWAALRACDTGSLVGAAGLGGARGPGLQHQDAGRLPGRARDRRRLPRVRPLSAAAGGSPAWCWRGR